VSKHGGTREAADDRMATRAQAHARARALTQTHAHIQKCVTLIAFLLQQSFRESASVLRYTYIACLFFFSPQSAVYLIVLYFLVHELFTLYVQDALKFKYPNSEPKGGYKSKLFLNSCV
jgi:hypothetical protein